FVNYRLGYEPVCDSTMTMTWNVDFSKNLKDLFLYPNPAAKEITIELSDQSKSISLFKLEDVQGKLLKTISENDNTNKIKFQVEDLPTGIYFINLLDNEGVNRRGRFIKR
ncbi:MAG: T9SS type A sorting domain-containing protein, partial [Saprospiraceae bacterium]|nr:T9SS type A sorting domain-containing protein [Candidatus Vicinibacter affinis]